MKINAIHADIKEGVVRMTLSDLKEQGSPNNDIILDNTKLERVSKTKFLDVTIDENLTWKNHIDGFTKTISTNIGMINKQKCVVPERILLTLYYTLVLPYISKPYHDNVHFPPNQPLEPNQSSLELTVQHEEKLFYSDYVITGRPI